MKTKPEDDALRDAIMKLIYKRMPTTDLVENWFFTYTEISLGNYRAKGREAPSYTREYTREVFGYGREPEEALLDCVQKVNKIIKREKIKKKIRNMLLGRIFGEIE